MKRILALFVLSVAPYILQAQPVDMTPLKREFELSPVLAKHFYGFCLYDLDSNRFLLGINEGKYFTPASNTKTFTLFAALKYLGDSIPGLHYVERGDSLIFWGTGDPTFLHSKLESGKVFQFLKQSNKKLFYSTESQSDEPFYRKGWSIEDYQEYYQPEVRTFPIYGNVVTFKERGGSLAVTPSYFEEFIKTSDNGNAEAFTLTRAFDTNTFFKSRAVPPRGYVNEKPFKNDVALFIRLLRDTLKKEIQTISYGKPSTYSTVYSNDTRTVLREMMLPSDNFLAEQLHMMIALQRYGKFSTAQLRKEMDAAYFSSFTDPIVLEDASGLSTYNKVSPRSMVELLLLLKGMVATVEELRHFFPAGGVDGTLKRAYSLNNGEPFVWAKTGTISSVHNQSGFIKTRSGKNLAFSFLNANFLGSERPIRQEMVRIITFIREHY